MFIEQFVSFWLDSPALPLSDDDELLMDFFSVCCFTFSFFIAGVAGGAIEILKSAEPNHCDQDILNDKDVKQNEGML